MSVLYSFTAAPATAPEIREGAASVELRVCEIPTPEIAANEKQSAIELRFCTSLLETVWALMEVWPDHENLVSGGVRSTPEEALGEALAAFEAARAVRELPNRGYAWGVVDTWTSYVRRAVFRGRARAVPKPLHQESTIQRNEHVLGGGSGIDTPRAAFEAGLPLFKQMTTRRVG